MNNDSTEIGQNFEKKMQNKFQKGKLGKNIESARIDKGHNFAKGLNSKTLTHYAKIKVMNTNCQMNPIIYTGCHPKHLHIFHICTFFY